MLDFRTNSKSAIINKIAGPIVQALGDGQFTFLEILANENHTFIPPEKIAVGKENRKGIVSVLGKLTYPQLSQTAKQNLEWVLMRIVTDNFKKYYAMVHDPLYPYWKTGSKRNPFDLEKLQNEWKRNYRVKSGRVNG